MIIISRVIDVPLERFTTFFAKCAIEWTEKNNSFIVFAFCGRPDAIKLVSTASSKHYYNYSDNDTPNRFNIF